nr:MAG TPA: hypothetical protein [Caudoviricetes sp.]
MRCNLSNGWKYDGVPRFPSFAPIGKLSNFASDGEGC